MDYDGWVVIKTVLDSDSLEKDLKNAERKLKQYQKEGEQLTKTKVRAESDLEKYRETKKMITEMTDKMNEYAQTEDQVNANLENEARQLAELDEAYAPQLEKLGEINQKIQENATNQALMTEEVGKVSQKLKQAKLVDQFKNAGKSVSDTIKKVARLGLAIFGLRALYSGVQSAISKITSYNQDLANKIESVKLVLAASIEPIVTRVVNLVHSLLNYVNYIAKAWFNVDLFAAASALSMKKGANSAEKMRKSMAGFDEMNVVSDNSGGGNTPGFVAPEDAPIPSWIQWIGDNKDTVIAGLAGIAAGLLAVKLGFKAIQGLGISLIIAGVVLLIQGVIDLLNDPSWDAFLTVLQGIALIVAGIAVLMGGWIVALVALGVAIVAAVIKNWDKVKEILGKVGSWINEKIIQPIAKFFSNLWNKIVDGVNGAIQKVKSVFNSVVNFFKNIINTIVGLFKKIGTKVGDAVSGAFKAVINGILKVIENILNNPIKAVNKLLDVINAVPGISLKKLPTFNLPRLKVGGIVNLPSRGVPVGGAIAGEAGAEGVIPLTDSQAMETLGEAIGRYINVNATIPIYVGNRQIARELKQINSRNDFAFNK